MLYYILILCILRAQPIAFQDMEGQVFFIHDTVRHLTPNMSVPGDDVLALIDADDETREPDGDLFDTGNFRVLLTSSPRGRKDRRWLTQMVRNTNAVYVMKPWSWEEMLVTSFVFSAWLVEFVRSYSS